MIKLTRKVDLEGCTLIVPSVAVGNVAQLAVDLMIFNFDMQRIGRVAHFGFIPIVGLNPYNDDSKDLCTAVDVYANVDKKIVVVQVRSPLVTKYADFFYDVESFIMEYKLSKLVILTSGYAYEKQDNLSKTTDLYFKADSGILSEYGKVFKGLKWIQYEPKTDPDAKVEDDRLYLPGGGYARSLYRAVSATCIPSMILFKYCSEGDNIPDAIVLVNALNQWLCFTDKDSDEKLDLKHPPSWKYLFGNPPTPEMY